MSCRQAYFLVGALIGCSGSDSSDNPPLAGAFYDLQQKMGNEFESRIRGCEEVLAPEQKSAPGYSRIGKNPNDDGSTGFVLVHATSEAGLNAQVLRDDARVAEEFFSLQFLLSGEQGSMSFGIDEAEYQILYRGALDCEGGSG